MSICPGSCNRSWRRAEDAHQTALQVWEGECGRWETDYYAGTATSARPAEPEPHGVIPAQGEPVWCSRCTSLIRRAVLELDDLAAILTAQVDGHRPPAAGQRVSGSGGSPSPEPRLDTLDELLRELGWWEGKYRAAQGWPTRPAGGRFATALTRTVAWLHQHLDGMLAIESAAEFGRDVLGWNRRLQDLTRTRADVVRKPVPCPRCGSKQLVLKDADRPRDRRVECAGWVTADRPCGRMLTMDEYSELADAYDRAVAAQGAGQEAS